MQQSIKKSLARAASAKEAREKPPEQNNISNSKAKKTKSSLIAMLSSQLVPRNVVNAADISAGATPRPERRDAWRFPPHSAAKNKEKSPAAPAPAAPAVASKSFHPTKEVINLVSDAEEEEGPAASQQMMPPPPYNSKAAAVANKVCPLCGVDVPESEFEGHMQEELEELDNEEWTEVLHHDIGPEIPLPPRSNAPYGSVHVNPVSQRKRPRDSNNRSITAHQQQQPKVYVLGGAPKDRKKLGPLPPRKKPLPAFNHFADGGGLLDGDELGIAGHESVGINAWEGVGATTM